MKPLRRLGFSEMVLILVVVFVTEFFAMPATEYPGDPPCMRCETVSLLTSGNLAVPAEIASQRGVRGQWFFENEATHRWYSKYGILNGLIYLPPLLLEKWTHGGQLSYFSDDRVLYLNGYNLLFAVATAAYLFKIAARYTNSLVTVWIFVISSLFSTFWWNYLRAQTPEIYQTFFLLGFYYHWVEASPSLASDVRPADRKSSQANLACAGSFLGLLLLSKTVYVLLIPIAEAMLVFPWIGQVEWGKNSWRKLVSPLVVFSVPLVFACGVMLATNAVRFGSPFETGYGQWLEHGKPFMGGNLLEGLHGYLFSVQESIFIYFPLVVFALPSFRSFWIRHRRDCLLFLAMAFLLLFFQAKMVDWFGGWCYGPRYLLPILPLVSLPFILTIDFVLEQIRHGWAIVSTAVMALVLLYSFHLQLNTNSLPFLSYFPLRDTLATLHRPDIDAYFNNRPIGIVYGDLQAYKNGRPWLPLEDAAPLVNADQLGQFKADLAPMITSNYYLFPDESSSF